jgi:hypothetical protein
MNTYPADEQRISEVERGRSCNAVLPFPPGKSLCAGDSILFAQAYSPVGPEPCYVKSGDSVRVILTHVTDLGATDPATGHALFQLSWEPLGQDASPETTTAKRGAKRHLPVHMPRHPHPAPGLLMAPAPTAPISD